MAQARSGIFLLAIGMVGAPSSALAATTGVGVTATVMPTCIVSTETRTSTPSVTCSDLGGGDVSIRTAPSSRSTAARPATHDPLEARDAARGDGVSYVTVTY